MFLWIGVGSGIGVLLGLLLGFLLGRSGAGARATAEQTRAEKFAEDLSRLRTELEAERARANAAENDRTRLEEMNRQAGQQLAELRSTLDRATAEVAQNLREAHAAQIDAAKLRQTLEAEKAAAEEKIAVIQNAREELSNQFKALANDILEQKAKTFTEQNQSNLTTLLTPLREKFGEFQQKVESLEKEGITGRTELRTQIEQLRTLNERLSEDASNLATALKGSSKIQGDWGEFVLEKLLESAGLRRNFEYRVQSTLGREDGGNARLDVILDLPDDRHLIIDSKVSLNSYSDYCNTDSEEERREALRLHLQSIRTHLKGLSAREYQDLYSLKSLDFVLMFVPIEPAFMLAIGNDNRLWQDAYDKNVLLVSPSSLLCVVRTVAQIWRQEHQARNVEEIAKRGRILLDKFVGFTDDLQRIGRKLGEAREAYEGAYNKLARADGNLVSQAQKLIKLGIRPNKALAPPLLDQSLQAEEGFELAAESDETGRPQ
jgi:DNA recombination protein RmuC